MATDFTATIKWLAVKEWRRVEVQSGFLAQDGVLVRHLVKVGDAQQQTALEFLDRFTDVANAMDVNGVLLDPLPAHVWYVDNPRAGAKTYPGRWRLVSNKGGLIKVEAGEPPQLGIIQTLAMGYWETLLIPTTPPTAGVGTVDFTVARISQPGQLNQFAEMFDVVFPNLNPEKLDAMLTELREHIPYENPVIQGNPLSGNFIPVTIRAHQAEDGSGVIVLKACKGGRNFGNLEVGELAERIKFWNSGNVSYTELVYYYRQTYEEINALIAKLKVVTGANGTPGVDVICHPMHFLHETEEGGPYNLMVEISYQGNQTATGWRKTIFETDEITHQLAAAQPTEPDAAAGGVSTDVDAEPRGDGLFHVRKGKKTEQAIAVAEVSNTVNAHGVARSIVRDKGQPADTSLAASYGAGVTVHKRGQKSPGGLLEVETDTFTLTPTSVGPVEVFNDGIVKHEATYYFNQANPPPGASVTAAVPPAPAYRTVYLHPEFSELGGWNYVGLKITILTASLVVVGKSERNVSMNVRFGAVRAVAFDHAVQWQPDYTARLEVGTGRKAYIAVTRSFYLVPTAVDLTDTTDPINPPRWRQYERNNGYDATRMVWWVDNGLTDLNKDAAVRIATNAGVVVDSGT